MTKLNVMSLNAGGVAKFQTWLENPVGEPPQYLLTDHQYCDAVEDEWFVETHLRFATSFDLGQYLAEKVFVKVLDPIKLHANTGIWAWISLAMVQNLLKKSNKQIGRPLDKAQYLELNDQRGRRLGYRLIARTAWDVVRLHGTIAIVALGSKRSPWGEMAEQLSSRQYAYSHPCFWAIAHRAYLDSSGNLKEGATSKRPAKARKDPKNTTGKGGVRRLPFTFRQFDRTYNTRELSLDHALAFWPSEYGKWIRST